MRLSRTLGAMSGLARLAGLASVLFFFTGCPPDDREDLGDRMEDVGDSLEEAGEEVADEIDDHT